MNIERFENSIFNSNTYVVDNGHSAIIVDIGDYKKVAHYLDRKNLYVVALLITHTHYDHIYGIREFLTHYPMTPIFTSEFGKEAFKKPNWNFSRYHEDELVIESENITLVENEDSLDLAEGITVKVKATPGHDKSCLSYFIDNKIFTGDSFIPNVKVVASFPNSNKVEARKWYEILNEMSNDYDVYPGHGPVSIHLNNSNQII